MKRLIAAALALAFPAIAHAQTPYQWQSLPNSTSAIRVVGANPGINWDMQPGWATYQLTDVTATWGGAVPALPDGTTAGVRVYQPTTGSTDSQLLRLRQTDVAAATAWPMGDFYARLPTGTTSWTIGLRLDEGAHGTGDGNTLGTALDSGTCTLVSTAWTLCSIAGVAGAATGVPPSGTLRENFGGGSTWQAANPDAGIVLIAAVSAGTVVSATPPTPYAWQALPNSTSNVLSVGSAPGLNWDTQPGMAVWNLTDVTSTFGPVPPLPDGATAPVRVYTPTSGSTDSFLLRLRQTDTAAASAWQMGDFYARLPTGTTPWTMNLYLEEGAHGTGGVGLGTTLSSGTCNLVPTAWTLCSVSATAGAASGIPASGTMRESLGGGSTWAASKPGGGTVLVASVYAGTTLTTGSGPRITSMSVTLEPPAGGGAEVITGSNFNSVGRVRVGPTNLTTCQISVDSPTQITIPALPGEPAADYFVDVFTLAGQTTHNAANQITYGTVPAPTITGLSAATGVTTGGFSEVVTGTAFSGVTAVKVGATSLTSGQYTVNSATQITIPSMPAEAAGAFHIDVTATGGTTLDSSNNTVTYQVAPPPTITSMTVQAQPLAGGSQNVLTGTNFTGVTSVKVGATSLTSGQYTVNSVTQLTIASMPAESVGSYFVDVSAAGGTTANNATNTVVYSAGPTYPPAGSTNMSSCIGQALENCGAGSGLGAGNYYFPPGTYYHNGTIVWGGGVNIYGANTYGATVFNANDKNNCAIGFGHYSSGSSSMHWIFHNCQPGGEDGNRGSQVPQACFWAGDVTGTSTTLFANNAGEFCEATGFWCGPDGGFNGLCSNVIWAGNKIYRSHADCIRTFNGVSNFLAEYSICEQAGDDCYEAGTNQNTSDRNQWVINSTWNHVYCYNQGNPTSPNGVGWDVFGGENILFENSVVLDDGPVVNGFNPNNTTSCNGGCTAAWAGIMIQGSTAYPSEMGDNIHVRNVDIVRRPPAFSSHGALLFYNPAGDHPAGPADIGTSSAPVRILDPQRYCVNAETGPFDGPFTSYDNCYNGPAGGERQNTGPPPDMTDNEFSDSNYPGCINDCVAAHYGPGHDPNYPN